MPSKKQPVSGGRSASLTISELEQSRTAVLNTLLFRQRWEILFAAWDQITSKCPMSRDCGYNPQRFVVSALQLCVGESWHEV